jgi:transposase
VGDVGEKGNRGVLKSQESRARFLSNEGHRIRFVYLLRHSSWINQIETWFSILVRKLLRRSSFRSVEHLEVRILAFVEYFNLTMAEPIHWLDSEEPKLANGTG